MNATIPDGHLTSEELAAYIDGRLDPAQAARIESHMADCAACRADLVATRPLVEEASLRVHRGRSYIPRRGAAWLAAAAVIAIAFLPMLQHAFGSRGSNAQVRATQTSRTTIEVVSPRTAPVDAESVVFAWRPVAGASTYRLTLTDSSGEPLFGGSTAETTFAAAARAKLHRGSHYLWYVDALTSDGRTVSSGIRSFMTSR